MQYRIFGHTGLSVSQISLGTVELGLPYGIGAPDATRPPSRQNAELLLHYALDQGVNLLDTARTYGASEEIIGACLSHRRQDFILASKVKAAGEGSRRRSVMMDSIVESLRVLRTDYLDVLLLHGSVADDVSDPECLEILVDAKRRGMTRFIGASVYGPAAASASIGSGVYDCVQLAWSLLDRRPEANVIAMAADRGVGIMARSVLMRGALTSRRSHLPASLEAVGTAASQLSAVADRAGMSLPELAYRYVLSSAGPITALIGTAHVGELQAAINCADSRPLPADVIAAVRDVEIAVLGLEDLSRWPNEDTKPAALRP